MKNKLRKATSHVNAALLSSVSAAKGLSFTVSQARTLTTLWISCNFCFCLLSIRAAVSLPASSRARQSCSELWFAPVQLTPVPCRFLLLELVYSIHTRCSCTYGKFTEWTNSPMPDSLTYWVWFIRDNKQCQRAWQCFYFLLLIP